METPLSLLSWIVRYIEAVVLGLSSPAQLVSAPSSDPTPSYDLANPDGSIHKCVHDSLTDNFGTLVIAVGINATSWLCLRYH